jgi:PAS domain S-box-containing protein
MEFRLKQFLAKNPYPVFLADKDETVLYSNETGIPLLHELGTGIGEKLPPLIGDFVKRAISQNKAQRAEVKVEKRTYIFVFQVWKTENNVNIYGFDVTDQRNFEEAFKIAQENLIKAQQNVENIIEERAIQLAGSYDLLKESEKELVQAHKMAHIGTWEWEIATDSTYWSDEMFSIFRRDPLKLAPPYNEYLNYVHHDDQDYVDNAFKKSINGEPFSIDYRIILSNGEERTVHMQSEVIIDDKNIPIRIKGFVQDITERTKSNEKIKTLANIVELSNDAIITKSLDGIITSWNKGAEQMYGYSAQEIIGRPISILAPNNLKGEISQLIEEIEQEKKIQNYETLRVRKDGTIINVSISLSPVYDASGKLADISIIARDITIRKEAQEALANIEIARKKEIHHRIKNNLQVISSLLDLQAERFKGREDIKDSEVLEAFRESQDRVLSMALIHEELYEGEGDNTVNFPLYIKKLVENLFQTYMLRNTDISLNMDLDENLLFDMDNAVPLGMIVNELVSNSLKYAFPGRDRGEIQIKLHREESKTEDNSTSFTLTVSDNGVGIPENLDIEDLDTLGFQLITSLVDQLDGEFELKRNKGTEFTMKFRVTEK